MNLISARTIFTPPNGSGTPITINTPLTLEYYNKNVGYLTATKTESYGQACPTGYYLPVYGNSNNYI
ncbi:hypothetical protein HMPREF1564_1669 [Providencia alcalifaciens R90-1475]|nr:hypothetical protein HMPREF1564_1669 [Providencia alcalifaciens R90-1475]